jgi:hypothetical protein
MFTRIEDLFWKDEKLIKVSPNAKYLFLYLLSNPHRNILGLYYLPKLYIVVDTGLPEETVSKGLEELFRNGLITVDNASKMVLINNFMKYNPLENPNQVTNAVKKIKELPRTDLINDLIQQLQGLEDLKLEPLITVLKGLGKGLETLSKQEEEEEKEKEEEEVHTSSMVTTLPVPLASEKQTNTLKQVQVPYQEIVDDYNSICLSLPQVQIINKRRKKSIKARFMNDLDHDVGRFKNLFRQVEKSDFLTNRSGRKEWRANFDWIINPNNMVKILEGNYDNAALEAGRSRGVGGKGVEDNGIRIL